MLQLPLHKILFLDVETVSQYGDYEKLPADWQALWVKKSSSLSRDKEAPGPEKLYERAAIYAEFGKIVCISCGYMTLQGGEKKLSIKSFFGHDEKKILQDFTDSVVKLSKKNVSILCAHNGKEFDFPYICRRLIINQLPIPASLQIAGKKPWEIEHLDTMELWKFGDYKSYTSLVLLAHSLGIATPKDDIDGSMVGDVYWKENNVKRIATYCEKDVITVAQICLRLCGHSLLTENEIQIKE